MTADISNEPELIDITSADGYRVAASLFNTKTQPLGHLIVAGATGVPQRFYYSFARYASSHGYTTLTLDYRGIGRSRPSTLVGFQASFIDWADDLAAAVEYMASDEVPLFMVGHSFGGHAFGLLPNHQRISGFYVFAIGAGWHGWMPTLESLKVRFIWNIVLPTLAIRGYAPMSLLGIGEDLPFGVYQQWRHWCSFPHYFFDDPEATEIAEKFAQVTAPIVAANALDDNWALPRSRNAFIKAYKNSQITCVDLVPDQHRHGCIGHMGYFRPQAQPLWEDVLNWFKIIQ
ncbi:alpha/beta hydrolase family protein [Desulforhopalus singaporensis]|uniref:Predicted alpha/beta hydrolase n=1 Tax=Desulforhopalus singaporensis TaxID=91360 RepID=A0A1H0SPS1_9BACT|nr:alpha/beta fold hydrolase [Desulforhopalus singaporensis]SDP43683.1 Predicted alpha/beta hydrolase [Desulforhopalus singaporensis]